MQMLKRTGKPSPEMWRDFKTEAFGIPTVLKDFNQERKLEEHSFFLTLKSEEG